MITAKILILIAALGIEFTAITSVLEYFDAKKYAKDDAEYRNVIQNLQTMKKGEI